MGRVGAMLKWAAGGWFVWRIFGPEVQPRYAPEQARPLRLPGRTVFVGEREFFVREAGPLDAPPLVLVHGWSLDGEMTYHRVVPALAESHRVIIPDHRNHGRSEWVRGPFDVDTLADELAGVLDALGVGAATVFGWSMGGMATQELALRRPDLVARMILGGTAAYPIAARRPAARALFWMGRAVARISRYELTAASRAVLRRSGSIERRHERWMRTGLLRRDPALYYESGAAVWRFDSRAWIGRVKAPALVIIPTEDQLVPPAAQYELAGLLGSAEIVELVGGRHESILNRPEDIVRAIRSFTG